MEVQTAVVAGGLAGLAVGGPVAVPTGAIVEGCTGLACSEGPELYQKANAKIWRNRVTKLESAENAKKLENTADRKKMEIPTQIV